MTAIMIILAILLFIFLVMLIRVKIVIDYKGDDVKLKLKVLGIPFSILPKKEKRKKIRLSDYSPKALEKRRKKEDKKNLKKASKKSKKSPPEAKEKQPITKSVGMIAELVKYLLSKFLGHLRIDMTRIVINVGTDDAAKTAILFGAVNQGVLALLEILNKVTNVKRSGSSVVAVHPDYLSEKITRAVFAEMVYKFLYDGTLSGATKSYFNDVDLYHYAAPYIQNLSEGGIISGYGDGNFYPDKN
ncbi:MAG: S-layer homology domain-containing protein, partial [Clostridia bacterium]|nr:S-layer homology domain-containing protein [Clostridia bacterium]